MSGLFPAAVRPRFREPHPVRVGAVLVGAGMAALWVLLFGLLASSLRGFAWLVFSAGAIAWSVALLLVLRGDRGVAVGIAASTAASVAIAVAVVIAEWATRGWPLW